MFTIRIYSKARVSMFALGVCACFTCSVLPPVADSGSGTNTGNARVIGTISTESGSPAGGTAIIMRPAGFLKDTAGASQQKGANSRYETITADDGTFSIDSVDTGDYRVEANDQRSMAVLMPCTIRPGDAAVRLESRLASAADLTGYVSLSGGSGSSEGGIYVQIYGLDRVVRAGPQGRFSFTGLPAGTFRLRTIATSPAYGPRDTAGVSIAAGSLQTLDTIRMFTFNSEEYAEWAHSRKLFINTTRSGAGISDTMARFPLLIRLTKDLFPFAECGTPATGADVRFAGESGKHLPYEIEHWALAANSAEFWVCLDTIFGNSNDRFITVYWGKNGMQSWSNPAAVFDTALGFAAVWHLGASLTDATLNANNGADRGAALSAGAIGECRLFDGVSSSIAIDSSSSLNMAGKGLSIMLWEKSTGQYNPERMFFEHDVWANEGNYGFSTRTPITLSFDFPSANNEARGDGKPLADGAWHQVAVAFDDALDIATVYHDGIPEAVDSVRSSIGSSNGKSFIGSRGGFERFFKGSIDEMWIMSRPQSSAYLKLIYENQRPDQRLISIR